MRRLIAFLFSLAFVAPAYAQQTGGPGGGGSSITTPVSPANGGSGVANSANLTWNNAFTLTGTSAQTYTFPTTTATLARTDAAQSFTGNQTFGSGIIANGGFTLGGQAIKAGSGGNVFMANAAVSVSAGCGTSPTVASTGGTIGLQVTIGSSPGTTCTLTFPSAAAHGWSCAAYDLTTNTELIRLTSFTSTTVSVFTFYNAGGTATAPAASDVVIFAPCVGV